MADDKKDVKEEPIRQFGYGRVIQVHSGDSFSVIGGATKENPVPPVKEIAISGVRAPRVVRGRTGVDENFGWEAKEYLRKYLMGKQVRFNINVQSPGSRDYADVFLERPGQEPEEIANTLIKEGWVKLNEAKNPNADQYPERQARLKLQGHAEENRKGIWQPKPSRHCRELVWGASFVVGGLKTREERNSVSDTEFSWAFDKKGQELDALVIKVRDGHIFRCEIKGLYRNDPLKHKVVLINLSGVSCPQVPPPIEVQQQRRLRNPTLEIIDTPPPFALEAQRYSEERLLHQDVKVIIDGADKLGNIYGTIMHEKGNISLKLLESGYGKLVPWTASFSPLEAKLTEASNRAKEKHLRSWSVPVPQQLNTPTKLTWEARVTEVTSGDTVRFDGDADKRFSLASLRAPRLGRRGQEPDKFYFEAREFVRQRLFGKKVKVIWAYNRFERDLVNLVYHDQYKNKDVDLSEELVADGLAEVVIHSTAEARAPNYGKLLQLERRAKKQKKHKWGENNPCLKVFDLTNRGSGPSPSAEETTVTDGTAKKKAQSKGEISARADRLLNDLKRSDKQMKVVVEYCYSGGKMKVYLPNMGQHGYLLNFVIAGVNCAYPKPRGGGPTDPIGLKALQAARAKLLQQDNVRIGRVETKDKGENFLGKIYFGKKEWGQYLVQQGLAMVRYDRDGHLWEAQEKAKTERKGLWKDFVEPEPQKAETQTEETVVPTNKEPDVFAAEVTEIMDCTTFFVRRLGQDDFKKVQEAMQNLKPTIEENFPPERANGIVCAGQFSDQQWYRVRIASITRTGTYRVTFIDYGNSEELSKDRLAALPEDLAKVPSTCRSCVLAGIKAPGANSAYANPAAHAFNQMAFGFELVAKIESEERGGKIHVTLTPKTGERSINSELVRGGWARVISRPLPKLKSYVKALQADETFAKNARLNIWEYGDVSDEEEEDTKRETGRPPSLAQKRAANQKK